MKITNKLNLPSAIVEAVKNDDYDSQNSDFTVTQLIDSPQKVKLSQKYKNKIIEDASERIYSLVGKAVHNILEKAEVTAITEKRLFMTVDGVKISGQLDRLALMKDFNGRLQDYKMASVWEYIYGLKKDRENQLNMLALLLRHNNYTISKLEIVMIFRDWMKSKAKHDPDYPQQQVAVIDVPLWTEEEQVAYLTERIKLFKSPEVQPCSEEARWYTGDKYAVMKPKRKTALRVLDTRAEAALWIVRNALDQNAYVEYRPGISKRCEDYCSVKAFCNQYNQTKEVA